MATPLILIFLGTPCMSDHIKQRGETKPMASQYPGAGYVSVTDVSCTCDVVTYDGAPGYLS